MSILLDSLKKSEAQRVMGGAPSIFSDGYDSHPRRSSHGWLLWLMLGVGVVAISWFGWRQYAPPGDSEAVTADFAPIEVLDAEKAEAPAVTRPALSGDTRDQDRISADSAERSAEEETVPLLNRSSPEDKKPAPSTDGSWSMLSKSVATYSPPETRDSVADETELPEQESPEPTEDVTDPEFAFQPLATESVADDPAFAEPLSDGSVAVAPGTSAISYWALPQSLRNALPEFRITVLVYAEQPADRFLLMNGERLREQDSPESGLVLEEIRRDGAIFTYRNYRFLVAN